MKRMMNHRILMTVLGIWTLLFCTKMAEDASAVNLADQPNNTYTIDGLTTGNLTVGDAFTNTPVGSPVGTIIINGATGRRVILDNTISDNINIEYSFPSTALNNESRITLTKTNTFQGTITGKGGILYLNNAGGLGHADNTLYLDASYIMTDAAPTITQGIVIANGSWAGLRASNQNFSVTGSISGGGDFIVVTDGATLTLNSTNANTYTGVTGIGTVQGGGNTNAFLKLGKNEVLPSTTVVELGKSSKSAYGYTSAGSQLQLDGKTQTIAGLYGVGQIVGGNGILNINAANGTSYDFTGLLSNVTINLDGTGTQIIGGGTDTVPNTATNTNVNVNSGTLELAKTTGVTAVSTLTVNNGGMVRVNNNGTRQQVSGLVTVNSGGTLNINGGLFSAGGGLVGDGTVTGGGTMDINTGGGTQTFTGALTVGTINKSNNGTQNLSPTTSLQNTNFTVTGGTLQINTANAGSNYLGNNITVNGGTFQVMNTAAAQTIGGAFSITTGTFNLNGATVGTTGLNGAGTLNGNGTLNISLASGASHTFTGTFTAAGAINISGAGGTQTIGGGNNASGTNITVNSGTLIFDKTINNTLASTLTINNGAVVEIKSGNATTQVISNVITIATGGTLNVNGGNFANTANLTNNGTINLSGGNLSTRALISAAGQGNIVNAADTRSVLTINQQDTGAEQTYRGTITGDIRLVSIGAGRQRFEANLEHTGGTSIEAGTFYVTNNIKVGTGAITLKNAATFMTGVTTALANDFVVDATGGNLRIGGASTLTLNGNITGTGLLTLNNGEGGGDAKKLVLNGDNSGFSGGIQLGGTSDASRTTVEVGNDSGLGTGTLKLNNAGPTTLTFVAAAGATRTIANEVDINGRNLTFNASTGANALFSGSLTGGGTFISTGVDYLLNLSDWTADHKIWSGLTAGVTFTDAADVMFYFTASNPDDLIGQTFSLFEDATLNSTLTSDNFSFIGDLPSGVILTWTAQDTDGYWGITLTGYSVTPEPATWVMMIMAGLGVFFMRRRSCAAG